MILPGLGLDQVFQERHGSDFFLLKSKSLVLLGTGTVFLSHLNKFSTLVVRFYATCGRRGWLNRVVTNCSRPWLIVAQSAHRWAPVMVQQAGVAHRFSYHGMGTGTVVGDHRRVLFTRPMALWHRFSQIQ